MSWFRFTGGSRGARIGNFFLAGLFPRRRNRSRSAKRGFNERGSRLLTIDPLESRCLLSVTPATLSAIIVNQTFGQTYGQVGNLQTSGIAQATNPSHSVASDNTGDFIVTWTRSDAVRDAAGQPVINPATAVPYQAENVYARYFTNTQERITLPAGTSRFSLTDNVQTIEQISITGGTAPWGDPNLAETGLVAGTFTLWFDTNGNGAQDAGETNNFTYDELNPWATASAVQAWLDGFALHRGVSDASHATVNAIDAHTFVVDFGTATQGLNQSSLLQYVPASGAWTSGFLPAVTLTNLSRPFTINNIPVSPTNPNLTAQAIASYFQPPSAAGTAAVAPVNFPEPAETRTPPYQTLAPYTEPVATNAPINTMPTTFVTAKPVTGGKGTAGPYDLSPVEFDVTFTGYVNGGGGSGGTGATVDAPMVVTNCVSASGAALSATSLNVEGVPYNPPGSAAPQVKILKQSGNEFQVNPPQPNSIYTQSILALNSDQPAVAVDGSGNFVIAWREQVGQQQAPKDITNVYFRRYAPVGLSASFSGAFVPGEVTSDLFAEQLLTFNFTAAVPTSNTDTFVLQVGSATTASILFNTNPSTTAAAIQTALVNAGFSGVSVAPESSGNPFIFDVIFGSTEPPIEYVQSASTLPSTLTVTATSAQAFTGVRLLANPTQQLTFYSTAAGAFSGTFQLQVGAQLTPAGAITFDSTDLPGTAASIQAALVQLGYSGVNVSVVSSTSLTVYTFNVTFAGASANANLPAISYVGGTLPATVAFVPVTDPYTQQANINYTNPQYNPAVTMDAYGNFVVVWANQGQDLSWFNTVSMERFDKNGNPLAYVGAVNNGALTNLSFWPDVAMGYDDNVVVTWSETADPQYLVNQGGLSTVFVRGFDAQLVPLWPEVAVPGLAGYSTIAMDGQDNFVVAANTALDPDAPVSALVSGGIYAAEYQLKNYKTGTPLAAPAVLRNTFRVNSADTNLASQTLWSNDQTAADVQMDIDGDIVTSYQGYGPAVSTDTISIPASFFQSFYALEQQQLTFTDAAGIPTSGTFQLQVGANPPVTVNFGATAAATAANIQSALRPTFPQLTVTGTSLAGNTINIFVVTFGPGPYQPTITGIMPAGVAFAASITQQPLNQDLLPYFDPFSFGNPLAGLNLNSGYPLGMGGVDADYDNFNSLLYQDIAGAIATSGYDANGVATNVGGVPVAYYNFNVDTVIDQVLFNAQYVEGASPEQVGRLRGILENVAGLLRGAGDSVLMTQVDANPQDSAPGSGSPSVSTYSDDVLSTQRSGQNQRYYITIPWDVQSGSFQLQIALGGNTTDVPDIVGPYLYTTGVIQMPSQSPGSPGATIDDNVTMQNIAAAVDAVLGTLWPLDGSVNVREVGAGPGRAGLGGPASLVDTTEIDNRQGTSYQLPLLTTAAENNVAGLGAGQTRTGTDGWFIFELVFQGQAHDVPIGLGVINANDQQWVQKKNQAGGTPPPAPTYTPLQVAAGKPVATFGDYAGVQGSPQYNASIAFTSAGSMVSAYTSEPVQSNNYSGFNLGFPSASTIPLNGSTLALGDVQNIYAEPLEETTDTAGPHVVGFTDANGVDLLPNLHGAVNTGTASATGVDATHLVLTFDEPMLADNPVLDADSVYNTSNYQFYNSAGQLVAGVISQVNYGLSEVAEMAETSGFSTNPNSAIPDNKWEVVLTINDAANAANGGALSDGTYKLVVRNAVPATATSAGQTGLRNVYGTPLGLTGYSPDGSNFTVSVTISSSTNPGGNPVPPGITATDPPINARRGGRQIDPAVATSASGNYVVVWTSVINGQSNIVGQLYNAAGTTLGAEFTVNTAAYTSCTSPDVGMDRNGNFVVCWSGVGPSSNPKTDPSDIFVRQYNARAQATNDPFLVDQWVPGVQQVGVQNQSRVAMAPDGTFVVTWTSSPISTTNVTIGNAAIFAREFSAQGVQLSNEIQVSSSSANAQTLSDVVMDSQDNFVIIWEGDFQSSTWGVYGAYFTYTGTAAAPSWSETGPLLLNNTPNARGNFTGLGALDLHDSGPRVAMVPATANTSANFVVTWANFTNTTTGYNVYAQIFHTNLSAASGAFVANVTTANWQLMPAVGVDSAGHITIVWTSYGQDNAEIGYPNILDYGIYARIFNADGSNFFDPAIGIYPMEFRVNATTPGDQVAPAVASNDPNNDAIMAWVGPDTKAVGTTAIYLRVVDPPPAALVKRAPVVTTNPSSQTVKAGVSVSFTAAATGTPTPTVQWQVSSNNGGTYANITAATSTTYTVTATAAQSGYLYRAVFRNSAGTATTTAATLKLNVAPVVTTNPVSQTVKAGVSVSFTAAATGTPTPTVQWQVSSNNGTTYSNIVAATATTYTFTTAAAQSGNLYRAVFTNSAGTATTAPATLKVGTAPVVTTNPSNQTFSAGGSVSFTAAATGTPTPTVQWQVSSNSGTTYSNIAAATATTYTFKPTAAQSGCLYRAVFTNSGGTAATAPATLKINTVPVVTVNPVSQTVKAGVSVSFTAAAAGTPAPAVQWQVSANNGVTYTNIAGATSATYTFTSAATLSGRLFRAVFTNSLGKATTTAATLKVNALPVVTTNPVSQTVNVGLSVSFTAAATSTPAPTVQWQVSANNGATYTNIVGAISTTYTFKAAATQTGYLFRAVFSNSAGAVTTTAAKLVVAVALAAPKTASASQTTNATAQTMASMAVALPAATAQTSATSGSSAPIQASAVAGPAVTRLSGAASSSSTTSSGITILQPAAVNVVLARRLV